MLKAPDPRSRGYGHGAAGAIVMAGLMIVRRGEISGRARAVALPAPIA
jgi:hypothetical protein